MSETEYSTMDFWSRRGRDADSKGKRTLAYHYFNEALQTATRLLEEEENERKLGQLNDELLLLKSKTSGLFKFTVKFPPEDKERFAEDVLTQAMNYDEKKVFSVAVIYYRTASKIYIELSKVIRNNSKHLKRANMAVTRLEKLSGVTPQPTNSKKPKPKPKRQTPRPNNIPKPTVTPTPTHQMKQKLTSEDIKILNQSGKINGKFYPAFKDEDDTSNGYFAGKDNLFSDPQGKLPISAAQKKVFECWIRCSRYFSTNGQKPKMIASVSPFHMKQTIVTDCSFVCSLCVTANYEMRFRKQLITSIIYPKDNRGIPVYNPSGKYMVKLWFNGIARKVVVDDFLPMSKYGDIMCSYSTTGDMWVSVIEKAYIKVNGGYDFPGSNGGIDLYSLTGWIPQNHNNKTMKKDQVWNEIYAGFHRGTALITAATGNLNKAQEDRYGLAGGHAYAVLNLTQVNGVRLMQIKNPWNKRTWKGPYSYNDSRMNESLRMKLKYDVKQADGGVFWIDLDSFIQYFEGLYVNWNPGALKNKVGVHRAWRTYGPADDSIIAAHNPQFRLIVNVKGKPGAKNVYGVVWIVLSRHVVRKDQILSPSKKDFLTVHIYDRRNGNLVLHSGGILMSGVYSNNPHVLCRLNAPAGTTAYTLVVSAYEKDNRAGLNYSLQVYSTENCFPLATLHQIPNKLRVTKTVQTNWQGKTAGGKLGSSTYNQNPKFRVHLPTQGVIRVRLLTHKEMFCNIAMYSGSSIENVQGAPKESSGRYRQGFCYVEVVNLNPGDYIFVPSASDSGVPGPIILEFESSEKITVAKAK